MDQMTDSDQDEQNIPRELREHLLPCRGSKNALQLGAVRLEACMYAHLANERASSAEARERQNMILRVDADRAEPDV